ncbi:MAG: HAD hydrolase-like protein, partial [Candidatus Omnitrophica bacterium]|nr:HAD hydrolase-like protein [Candidatus Omnitrophota bacterium]
MKTIVLFDIDGTLINTGGAGMRSVARAFEKLYGVTGDLELDQVAGRTDPAIFRNKYRQLLGGECVAGELHALTTTYLEILVDELDSAEYRILPGVEELLAKLSEIPGVVLGLATGNLERGAFLKLRRGQIDQYFKFGGYGSDSESRDELTRLAVDRGRHQIGDEAAKAVVIGDTRHDIESGKAAGARTL